MNQVREFILAIDETLALVLLFGLMCAWRAALTPPPSLVPENRRGLFLALTCCTLGVALYAGVVAEGLGLSYLQSLGYRSATPVCGFPGRTFMIAPVAGVASVLGLCSHRRGRFLAVGTSASLLLLTVLELQW
jgi:hypothetical protein